MSQNLAPIDIYEFDIEDFRRRVQTPKTIISTKGKRFNFPNGDVHPGPITAIVIDYIEYNALMEEALTGAPWDPDNVKPPLCWAFGVYRDEMKPEAEASKPQSDSCATCEHNQWRKDQKNPNRNFKACKNQFRLALIAPDATETSDILTLNVSPTGRKNWDKYILTLRTAGRHFRQQLTEINWDIKAQQTLTFKSTNTHELEPSVIRSALQRCTDERLLYASPIRT